MDHVKCPGWDGEKGVGLGGYLCGTEGEERLPKEETGKEVDNTGRLQARRKTVEVAG